MMKHSLNPGRADPADWTRLATRQGEQRTVKIQTLLNSLNLTKKIWVTIFPKEPDELYEGFGV